MKKALWAWLLLGALAVSAPLCAQTPSASPAPTMAASVVTDPDATFRMALADGWTHAVETAPTDSGQPLHTVRLTAPHRDDAAFRPNVGIQVLPVDTPLTAASKAQFRQGLVAGSGLKVLSETMTTLGDIPAWKLTFSARVQQQTLRGESLLASQAGHTWIVTFMAATADYPRVEAQVRAMLKTFRLT